MDGPARTQQAKDTLESFLRLFNEYAEEVFSERRRDRLDDLRTRLQRLEPQFP